MNPQSFEELERRASLSSLKDEVAALETRSRVHREIELMKAEGKAFELSAEEEQLILVFRRFKLRMRKNGEVFKFQTCLPQGVELVENTAQIVHPSEA